MTDRPSFRPDIQATQKAAAAPTADFLAYTRDELIREFPHLKTPDGTSRLLMGAYSDPALDPTNVLGLSYDIEGVSITAAFHTLLYADTFMGAVSKGGFYAEVGDPDRGVKIIGLTPNLCPTCEKAPDTICAPDHVDVLRRRELERFRTVNHEIGHLLGRITGFQDQIAALGRSDEWERHARENSAEAFVSLRAVQIYGDEGYYFTKDYEASRLKDPADPDQGAQRAPYYSTRARADLLEWAREHQDDLRTMSQGDLFRLANDKAPPLSPKQYQDLQYRANWNPAALSPEAARKRQDLPLEGRIMMPYLRDHDARIVTAEHDKQIAQDAAANLNPYRPPEARGKGIPAEGSSKTDSEINMAMTRFGEAQDPDCEKPDQNKPKIVQPKPSGP